MCASGIEPGMDKPAVKTLRGQLGEFKYGMSIRLY